MDVFLPDEYRTCHACQGLIPIEAVECGLCASDVTPQAVSRYISLRLEPLFVKLRRWLIGYAVLLLLAGATAGLLMGVGTTPGLVVVVSLAVCIAVQALLAREARRAPAQVALVAIVAVVGLHLAIVVVRPRFAAALSVPTIPYVGFVLRALLAGKEAARLSSQIPQGVSPETQHH